MELSSVKKTKIRAALENKHMSSDEECQDGFITPQNRSVDEAFSYNISNSMICGVFQ
jgi:hypothetical protein